MPDSLLGLEVYDDSILLPRDICDVLDCDVLDKMAPDNALERDVRPRVVEFIRWEAVC